MSQHRSNRYPKIYFTLILLAVATTQTGCSWLFGDEGYFRNREADYLKAKKTAPLRLPEGMRMRMQTELYPIPDLNRPEYEYPEEFEVPRPLALSSDIYEETVKIQKLGDKRWIFINSAASEVWPRIRYFLNRNNVSVDYTDVSSGVIETSWIKFKSDPDTYNKYRIIIEQGIQPDSAEIHVAHNKLSVNDDLSQELEWPEVSADEERVSWMIDELSQDLASDTGGRSTASLLAQAIGGNDKVDIKLRETEPVLRLEINAVRARATLQYSFEQGGFSIWDKDETNNIYYLNYIEPGDEPGFFGRLFGGAKVTKTPYSLFQVVEHLRLEDNPRNRALFPNSAFIQNVEPLKKVPGLLAVVTESDGGIEVTLRDSYGQPLSVRDARRLLGVIRSNLI